MVSAILEGIMLAISPMRQLGACTGNRNSPKLTHGAPGDVDVRTKTKYSGGHSARSQGQAHQAVTGRGIPGPDGGARVRLDHGTGHRPQGNPQPGQTLL